MLITLEIDTSSNKAQAFIDFIKTMDFIKIKDKESPEDYSLTKKQINILEERKQRHIDKKSESYSWEEIKEELIIRPDGLKKTRRVRSVTRNPKLIN